jgi:hypothetical protein
MNSKLTSLAALALIASFISIATSAQDDPAPAPEGPDLAPEMELVDGGLDAMDAGFPDAGEVPTTFESPETGDAGEPSTGDSPEVDLSAFDEYEEEPVSTRFAKGAMEAGLGFGLAGSGDEFYLGVGGKFAYYVVNRLAPGIDLQYTHIFSDALISETLTYDYPDSFRLLPFLKFVVLETKNVAPYLMIAGGYEFQWGSEFAVGAGIIGGGGGVNVVLGDHVAINIELLGLHYWYEETRIYGFEDSTLYRGTGAFDGERYRPLGSGPQDAPPSDPDNPFVPGEDEVTLSKQDAEYICVAGTSCEKVYDDKDADREWFFPLITIGLVVFF